MKKFIALEMINFIVAKRDVLTLFMSLCCHLEEVLGHIQLLFYDLNEILFDEK